MIYKLTFGHQTMLIDSETLDPGELRNLKDLGHCAHFTLERNNPDRLPGMDHDPLDDIAKEIVGGRKYSSPTFNPILNQAIHRVNERGLQ